jgi:uncharacterized protein (TIGR02757 family)
VGKPKNPRPRGAREAERETRIHQALEALRVRADLTARVSADPVSFVHRYANRDDQEIVAVLASALAFGNVKAFRVKIEDALARLGPRVAAAADDEPAAHRALAGWKHRVYRGEDLAALVVGARRVQREAGSLGAAFAEELARAGELRGALAAWAARVRRAGGLDRAGARRGAQHILADPEGGSAAKRLMLLLRWMARPADGVDLGLWEVPASRLLIPVDTHVHKLGRNLGFTRRTAVSWKVAEEITERLRRFDPADPVKYDFALCHMGMLQRCPSRRDAELCEGCGIRAVCRHWSR